MCVTSPTYEGLSADIPSIAKFCKEENIKLLIDGAHGSLFPFIESIPNYDIKVAPTGINIEGVDIVV